jgi:hypothetical protein
VARLNNLFLGRTSTCPPMKARVFLDRRHLSLSWVSHSPRGINDTLNNLLRCGLIAGTKKVTTTDGPDDIATLHRSDPAGPFRKPQVDDIESLLRKYSDSVYVYTYLRQLTRTISAQGGWGRAAVSSIHSFQYRQLNMDLLGILQPSSENCWSGCRGSAGPGYCGGQSSFTRFSSGN